MTAAPPSLAPAAEALAPDTVVVRERRDLTASIVEFILARPDGSRLPDWAPGAHIDVVLPDGVVRQYSLCGNRWDATSYRIAVQRETAGRGGSVTMCEQAGAGVSLGFGGPRNNFRMAPAESYLFVAGGIGITPILPMIHQADLLGVDWRLLYLGRSRDVLAYVDDLAGYGDRVTIHCGDTAGRADLEQWRPRDPAVRVYACGPERLLAAVNAWGAVPGGFPPKIEHFTAAVDDGSRPRSAFEVVAARSGVSTTVATNETIVAALRRAGVEIITSCAQGVCGTCETDVLDGDPDHRDSLLDDAERESAGCLFPCVSRSRSERLVLDV